MGFLKASWGFLVVIGGLLVTLTLLMLMDGPQQRRDALRLEDEGRRTREQAKT